MFACPTWLWTKPRTVIGTGSGSDWVASDKRHEWSFPGQLSFSYVDPVATASGSDSLPVALCKAVQLVCPASM
jgi:hypothetical protein